MTDTAGESAAEPPPADVLELLDLDGADDVVEPDAVHEIGRVVVTGTDAVAVAGTSDGDDGGSPEVDLDRLCRVVADLLVDQGIEWGQLDLHLVSVETIADLNEEHLGSSGPTDVLAFPLAADDLVGVPDRAPGLLGDVVICPTVALEQSPGHSGAFATEMVLLALHGALHVLGHDHGETDERLRMQSIERSHLERLGLEHPVPAP